MPSPYSPPDTPPADPFIIEVSSQLSYTPRFEPTIVLSNEDEDDFLKPFIVVFRLDPFTTHDGVHGRPVPASARAHSHPEDIRPTTLQFQLSLGSQPLSPTPEPESNSNSEGGSPELDTSIKPGLLRYLDGDTAPSPKFTESPRAQFEMAWSPAPLFHPLPQPPRQSFAQLDNTHRSPTFQATPFDRQDHPFTRVDRTPAPEVPFQQSSTLMYPHSLAYHTGSGSGSMYAPQPALEEVQEPSNRYAYNSHTSGNDGYPITYAPAAGSYSYPQDNSRIHYSPQHSFSSSFARGDASSQETLFATPAQMANSSRQEEIYPSTGGDPNPSPMQYPGSNFDSTSGRPLGHAAPPALNIGVDNHYGSVRTYNGDHRDAPFAQHHADVRGIKLSSSPHQAQPDLIRRLPPPIPYNPYSRESYFQTSPRGYDQIASRGYDQGTEEQLTSEPRYDSRPSSVFDRRGSLTFERPVSRTSSDAFNRPPSGAFSRTGSGNLDLAGSDAPYPPIFSASKRPSSSWLDRPASRARDPFVGRTSLESSHPPGTITPMRIFDSPIPSRSHSLSPTLSTTSSMVNRRGASRASRTFTPFPPGGMNGRGSGKEHLCTVCNRNFDRPSTLKQHLNSHTGERPHLCPVQSCGRSFTVSSNLRRHVKGHKAKEPGPVPRARRNRTAARSKKPAKIRPKVLQERKNVESWCPESLSGMRNAQSLSSRPPFEMPEGATPLRAPLPAVRPHGQPGDENYEDRDSFFYAREIDQPIPYHPLVWELRPTLPGPLPSHADRQAREHIVYGYGGTPPGMGACGNHRQV
ncbi:unnamed protein product [Rhizoctonia solani]|uniref:C2H2-type domain-containing protein n=1 Tax=Rhizoctonia solani TaxID=456999 RepID=A0A8H3DZS3_9AGAM|nr:unnamed protein product [Rhizoctonia solani]